MDKCYVYIMTNSRRTTVYIGVTSNLARRVQQHQEQQQAGFTKRYRLTVLVYAEGFENIRDAIAREKQLKGWTRARKDALIESVNPEWRDLSVDV